MPSPRRFYLCTGQIITAEKLVLYPFSHIIGELKYVEDEGRRVTALDVYRNPVKTSEPYPLDEYDLAYRAIGDGRKIKCYFKMSEDIFCGLQVKWEIGQAALSALRSRYEKVWKEEPAQ